MKTTLFAALLAVLIATPSFADDKGKGGKGWKNYGGNWGARYWGWDEDDDWDEDDWDEEDWDDDDGDRWRGRYGWQPADRTYIFGRVQVDTNGVFVDVRNGRPSGEGEYGLSEMDYRSLRGALRGSATEFDRWLGSIPAGDVWRRHFETRTLIELSPAVNGYDTTYGTRSAPAPADDRLSARERDTVVRVLDVFDRAVESSEMREITRTGSFRDLHFVLREFATPPEERHVRQLSFSGRFLNRSLGTLNTGAAWQKHLALPDGIVAAAERPRGEVVSRERLNADELGVILERYDRVHRSPEYRAINSLPEFQATHQRLAGLVSLLRESPPPSISAAEELPPPPEPRRR